MVTKDFLMGFGAGKAQGGGGSSVSVEPLSVSANGAYTAPTGKAYSPVDVNVPNSYAAGDEGKVVSNGALVAQTTDTVTQNGTVDTTLINSLIVNVSGGGGASNVVTGTFMGTTDGEILEINIPYSGSGYPVAVAIFPTEGAYKTDGIVRTVVKQYAVVAYLAAKCNDSAPAYTGSGLSNAVSIIRISKSSASNASSMSAAGSVGSSFRHLFSQSDPMSTNDNYVMMPSATKMKVLMADTSYGFMANLEYEYAVVYSS